MKVKLPELGDIEINVFKRFFRSRESEIKAEAAKEERRVAAIEELRRIEEEDVSIAERQAILDRELKPRVDGARQQYETLASEYYGELKKLRDRANSTYLNRDLLKMELRASASPLIATFLEDMKKLSDNIRSQGRRVTQVRTGGIDRDTGRPLFESFDNSDQIHQFFDMLAAAEANAREELALSPDQTEATIFEQLRILRENVTLTMPGDPVIPDKYKSRMD